MFESKLKIYNIQNQLREKYFDYLLKSMKNMYN